MNRSGIYDSEDAAVVVRKDLEAKTVQFQNIASSRRYTLTYDGTTMIYDKTPDTELVHLADLHHIGLPAARHDDNVAADIIELFAQQTGMTPWRSTSGWESLLRTLP